MISSLHLNKIIYFFLIAYIFFFNISPCIAAVDIWEKKKSEEQPNNQIEDDENLTIDSPIISDDVNKIIIKIEEDKILDQKESVIGIFDPEENNLSLDMWSQTDGEEIKKVLKRINKLKLSKLSEDLLFTVLFTNAYSPKKNLNPKEFTKIKVNWLIKKKRIKNLETLLKNNSEVRQNPKAIEFLVNEYLSSADIKSACEKINFLDREVENDYLEKFKIYCLINNNRKDEAQLVFDLLLEKGFDDNFFKDKIKFLLGITDQTSPKILDNNLLNFYFSYVTSDEFNYIPNEKTDKYIWKFLSSANLIQVDNLEDENLIVAYEHAAEQNSFDSTEIFKIYLKMSFNFNQLVNAEEIYKNLPNYKARALIYQSVLLSDNVERKINLAFLLKNLFAKDKLSNIYIEELADILKSIDKDKIPEDYEKLVQESLDKKLTTKVKFDNEILHRSKIIKHFLDNNDELSRTEKDFKSVYKKIKKNKKYFISIKDVIVLESLVADGIVLPADLNYFELSSQLTVPQNLQDLVKENQIGLVMLKVVEIIGEDNISDLDSETLYFLNKIFNDLKLKKIRNNILSEALPVRA
tara:strand:+ start:6289 stop:8025 length:1737 start_codon:yes stop_codon:yes gene_type:complete